MIEVPNSRQKIHKLYIDWDKMLSQAEGIQSKDDLRNVALGAPADFLKILHKVGSTKFHADSVKVIVKVCYNTCHDLFFFVNWLTKTCMMSRRGLGGRIKRMTGK